MQDNFFNSCTEQAKQVLQVANIEDAFCDKFFNYEPDYDARLSNDLDFKFRGKHTNPPYLLKRTIC